MFAHIAVAAAAAVAVAVLMMLLAGAANDMKISLCCPSPLFMTHVSIALAANQLLPGA